MRDIEMPLVPVLARMERVGVGLDTSVLAGLSARRGRQHRRAEKRDPRARRRRVPRRLAQAARRGALREVWGCRTARRTKTGYSTDASVLATLAPVHPIAEKIVEYRELTKLKSTYLDALPRMLGEDGRLHTSFNQTVAATGRLSSSRIPTCRTSRCAPSYGRRIRAAFVPADAGRPDGLGRLQPDRAADPRAPLGRRGPHRGVHERRGLPPGHGSAGLRRRARESVEPEHAARAPRRSTSASSTGQSAHGLAESLKIGRAEAQEMIDRYYEAYPRVRDVSRRDRGRGAPRRVRGHALRPQAPHPRTGELATTTCASFGERTAMNHPMQGTAADIMKLAMIEVDRRLRARGVRARAWSCRSTTSSCSRRRLPRSSRCRRWSVRPCRASPRWRAARSLGCCRAELGSREVGRSAQAGEATPGAVDVWHRTPIRAVDCSVGSPDARVRGASNCPVGPRRHVRVPIGDEMSCTRD